MAEMGKYLYCIIACLEEHTFDAAAMGGEGVVHTVCHQGLAAVASDSPAREYERTRHNLIAHEKVLETVMKEFTLLPVRFGTVTDPASPLQDIHRLLSVRFEEFHRLLGQMEGMVELGIKAFWRDEKAVYKEILAENAAIREARNSLSGRSPEATHFARIRLGEMVKEALNAKRAKEAERVVLPLSQIAHGVRENEVLADRIVANAAFLVDQDREPEFDQAVSKLDEQLGQRLALKYIGPVPPYNFVSIVVNWKELRN